MGTKRASPKSIFEWKCPLFLYLYMYWVLKCKLFILFLSFYKPPSEGTNGGALRSATKVEIQQDESISHCLVVPVFWVAVHMIPERIFLWRERKSMIEWLRGTTATYKGNCCHIDFSCISLIHVVIIHENVILFPCIFKIFLIF